MTNLNTGNPGDATPAPPGWYPTEQGQRYWDGGQWLVSGPPSAGLSDSPTHYAPGHHAIAHPNGVPHEDRQLAMLTHLLGFVAAGLAPLVIYIIKRKESPFVRHHAAEALNLFITFFGSFIAGVVLLFTTSFAGLLVPADTGPSGGFFAVFGLIYVGILALSIATVVFTIKAAIAANRGDWYRIPICLHLVK